MKKRKDVLAPDGIVYFGQRIVRKGGRVKYAGSWWQHDKLLPFVGLEVGVRSEDYWITSITIWCYAYPDGKFLVEIV